jgi:hypothetical protein
VQTWGEATTDPAIRDIVTDMTDRMRGMVQDCVTAWLVKVKHREPAAAQRHAAPAAHRIMALYQAELLYTALRSPDQQTQGTQQTEGTRGAPS